MKFGTWGLEFGIYPGGYMARVTVEDCLVNVKNRFELVHLAANRVRQMISGSQRLIDCDNKDIVTSLREIAAGKVTAREPTVAGNEEESLKIDIPDFK